MRIITDDLLRVRASYDALAYLQERLFLQVEYMDAATHAYFVVSNTAGTITATYHAPRAEAVVFVDVSDFVRLAAARGEDASLRVRACEEGDADTLAEVVVSVTGTHAGIAPRNVQRPPVEKPAFADLFHTIAPAVLLADFGYTPRVVFEYTAAGLQPVIEATSEGGSVVTQPLANGANTLPAGTAFFRVIEQVEQDLEKSVFVFQPLSACDLYACVEWVGVTGEIKRATWHAGRLTATAYNAVQLQADARGYRTHKGREESALLWLDGLSPYDYAYYADIVTSSDVRVLMSDTPIAGAFDGGRLLDTFAVDVVTNSATPNDGGGEWQKLEVQIKTRKYDAVSY